MDTDVLIKVTKSSLKDLVASNFDVFIAEGVKREAVDEGKEKGYPDAILIERNISEDKIKRVIAGTDEATENIIRGLRLIGGESDTLRLFMRGNYDAIASDDQRFLDLIDGLGLPFMTPSSLLLYLWRNGKISEQETRSYLGKMKELISEEEYLVSMEELVGGG